MESSHRTKYHHNRVHHAFCLVMILAMLGGCRYQPSSPSTPTRQSEITTSTPRKVTPSPTQNPFSSLTTSPGFDTPTISSPGKGIITSILQTLNNKYFLYLTGSSLHVVDAITLKETSVIPDACEPGSLSNFDSRYVVMDCIMGSAMIDLKEMRIMDRIGPETNGRIQVIEIIHDGRWAVYLNKDHTSGSYFYTIGIWDIEAQEDVIVYDIGDENVTDVAMTEPTINPNHRLISAGYSDPKHNFLFIWDFASGEILDKIPTQASVNGVDFSPDGSRLASGDEGGVVRLWNPATGQEIKVYNGFKDAIQEVQYINSNQIKVAIKRQVSQVLNLGDGSIREFSQADQPTSRVNSLEKEFFSQSIYVDNIWGSGKLEFSPDNKLLAKGYTRVTVWDAYTGEGLQLF